MSVIELRTPAEIEEMRPAGRFVASVLEATAKAAAVGVNLLELDALAHDMIRTAGAESCYIDYHPSFGASPFGKVICTSVNDAVLHGLPFDYKLRDGDLLSLDFAASVNGWVADSAVSIVVGTPRDEDLRLIDTTRRALDAGIAAARPGNRIGDISRAIADVAKAQGYSINTDFGGHGVGRTMHGAGPRRRHRAVVPRDHRPHLHGPRRLDAAQCRRVARCALRAHDRGHRRRPDRAHAARLNATAARRWRSSTRSTSGVGGGASGTSSGAVVTAPTDAARSWKYPGASR